MSIIRDVISNFIERLNEIVKDSDKDGTDIKINIMDDTTLLEAADELMDIKNPPKYSMGFDCVHNDEEMMEAFSFYQEAFGANKIAEFSPGGPNNLHIIMEICGIEVLLHSVEYGKERIQDGGIWAYEDEESLWHTIKILSKDAQKIRMDSWPHWPIAAFITDKYGIAWTLHN